MQNLDLGPNDYRVTEGPGNTPPRGKQSATRRVRLHLFGAVWCAIVVAYIYWTKDDGSRGPMILATAMFAFAGGLLLSAWFNERQ